MLTCESLELFVTILTFMNFYACVVPVTTCSNASFALTLLREAKGCFDVILIEEQISDMNSYDFLQQITQQINIPVISKNIYT